MNILILKYYLDTMNAYNPQEPLTEAQIALNIKHYEYSQQFGMNYLNRFENNMRECHDFQFQRQNELNQKIKHRCLNSVGPPPRPFKKARYAWEIKNYDYTVRRMSEPSEQGSSRDNIPEEQSQEGSASQINVPEATSHNNEEQYSTDTVNDSCSEYAGAGLQVAPAVTDPHYENIPGFDSSERATVAVRDFVDVPQQQMHPVDPDAGLIRWHTRQLCRSIFDNTVNRMLENMGFSPVNGPQGLHPLLVLNLSDDEEREAEEAHQRALETHALSAALQQKGLMIPPPYQYEAIESATTSDYDSSEEEESELGDTGGSEDLAACEVHHPSIPSINPYVAYRPTSIPLGSSLSSLVTDKRDSNSCDVISPSAQSHCDFQNECDAHLVLQRQSDTSSVPNCGTHECIREDALTPELDDNENCITKSETIIEGKLEQVLESDINTTKTIDSENNNNDKFFIRNAIEMAIKQHGLGFQTA